MTNTVTRRRRERTRQAAAMSRTGEAAPPTHVMRGWLRSGLVVGLIYVFLVGVSSLEAGIKIMGAETQAQLFSAVSNPIAGLCIGILGTVLVHLTIEEHTTDTAGYTDLVFGLFHLCGLRFSPRIRDIADQRLWHLPETVITGSAEALKWQPIKPERIASRWDDLRRVAATIRHGHLPASVLIARLQASARQNQLTQAIQEYGRLPKSIWLLQYLHDEPSRRRVGGQLNKGESFHALRSEINFANQGKLRARTADNQDLQGECLTLLANAVSCWNTMYTQAALDHIQQRRPIDDQHIARLSTATHKHINLYGQYNFTDPATPPHGLLRQLNTTSESGARGR